MAPVQTQGNETVTQNFIRAFTQRGGPSPTNPVRYAGVDEQYLMVGDISDPIRGGINAINVNDPRNRGLFKRIGTTIDAPDITTNTVTFKQRTGGVPWYTFRLDCPINIYESVGVCQDPADLKNGWVTLNILSGGLATDRTRAGRTAFDGSEESTTEIGFTWTGGSYTIGGLVLGEQAAQQVSTEVVDITYGNYLLCANCGPGNDGTRWIYALQQTAGGSSAVAPVVVYSTDYGATWTSTAITGIGAGSLVSAIALVGSNLVVVSPSENAYFYAPINAATGAPGTWTKIATGFVAAKQPNDIYVESPNRIYFAANGGYIYVSSDITAGVSTLNAGSTTTSNLLRIDGAANLLVAVGASGAAIASSNQGVSWSSLTGLSGTVQAVGVVSNYYLWVGNSAGTLWFSDSAGQAWTQITLPNIIGIQDIVWATAEVGFIAATRTGPTAVVFGTFDGGRTWSEGNTSRFPGNQPTFGRANRLAVPQVPDPGRAANNLAVAGLGGGGVDGVIYLAAAAVY